ncbi:hypothetical protein A1O1_02067 [Capronia coronata CBS 617.96]|uniref:J domain-containing protein n=1 Tax=Capronia coronata CBS 617.96 TaxID=1182541 RepID=W9YVG0_9EURO|nr:uncharacterized protein A1O1_02067 [Capronia coronata CBS 617.96]EXJ93675.1 hypothetical protein A1O1_02067 [Capronia coronata CBS 617.96]
MAMSSAAPTRQALRHLRRLCTTPTPRETLPTARASPCLCDERVVATRRERRSTCAFQSRRPFSTTRTRAHEAESSPPTSSTARIDGQNESHTTTQTPSQQDKTSASTPDITNYYTLFPSTLASGPPPHGPFHIPLAQLKREFLQLQAQHHPDKYHHSEAAHRSARGMSSLLNTAYKTLSDPLLRARYLLHHNYGVDITSEDNNTHGSLTDQETLMEVLEAQEAIEEATTQEQIDALKEENKTRVKDAEKLLSEAFEKEDLELAKRECIRLNYWRSLQQGLHDWEPGKEVRLIH